ncbi:hypothetical protein D3C84_984060 [compost metagenome]
MKASSPSMNTVTSASAWYGAVKLNISSTTACRMNIISSACTGLRLAALPPIILPIAMATPYSSRIIAVVPSLNPDTSCSSGDK